MINLDPIHYISQKLKVLVFVSIVNGIIFIVLGVAIVFFPRIVQYLFVVGFVVVGLFSIVVAMKLSHMRNVITRFEIFNGNKKVSKK